jgi:hypothetical protein
MGTTIWTTLHVDPEAPYISAVYHIIMSGVINPKEKKKDSCKRTSFIVGIAEDCVIQPVSVWSRTVQAK